NVGEHHSYDLPQTLVVGDFHAKQTTGSDVFWKYANLCARNTQPCANRGPRSSPAYDDLGDCNQQCRYCGAAFWYGEKLKGFLIISAYEFYLDVISFNAFSDEVVFRINVLASFVKDWILH
nr:helitron helicase-like domain-containing protein [Tanacetum cinerariifolium]